MKKILVLFASFLMLINAMSVLAFADDDSLIDDKAGLFTSSQTDEISASLFEFTSETSYSAAVVTTDYAEGKTSQEYADDYYDNLYLYEGWESNGILFLIDMDNREVCISTVGDCISLYAGSIDYIIDSGFNELVDGNYSECILLMIESAYGIAKNVGSYGDGYYEEFPTDDDYYVDENYYNEGSSSGINWKNIGVCFVISLVIAAVSVLVIFNGYKNMGKGDEFGSNDLILNLTGSNDTVISRNVVTTKIPRNNNNRTGGRSGGGGGGSVHRSSGGFSHGGGSRKF